MQLVLALLLALASTAGTLAVPLLVKDVIGAFARDEPVARPVLLMAGAALGAAVTSAGSGYLLARLGEQMILRLRRRVMEHTLRLPLNTVRAQGPGNLVARITSDAMLLRAVVEVGVVQLPLAVVTIIATLLVMGLLDWLLVLITIASFAMAGAAIAYVLIRVKRNVVEQQTAIGDLAQRFTAHIAALTTIKAYRSEREAAARLGDDAARLTGTSLTGARLQSLISPVMGLGQQIALIAVMVGGGARMADGKLSTSDFAAFLLYLLQLVSPVTMAMTSVGRLQAGLAARMRFDELLSLPAEADADPTHKLAPVPVADAPAVVLDDVSYSYGGPGGPPTVSGVTFTVPRTGLTAVVGPSGAGKTTTLGLIERFMSPISGRIEILGHDGEKWPLHALRGRIAYVDQQFTLLEGTVRENLELGRSAPAEDGALVAAMEAVGLSQDVAALPDGMNTVLGREYDISGGQRQRLALARALLSESEIVLLDEPTSQLDGVNEQRFRGVVDELVADRAVVVVAHRFSTIRRADHVVLVEKGTVTDSGRHQELMGRCVSYRELVMTQAYAEEASPAGDGAPSSSPSPVPH
ncbi:ABC transporter ATP-binding protein [Streptomyces varsoviensis]|uniref:ABC transporter ATP-binding protein n=1 Tax=Streptomyces varsoviensis TaxID=67373 RepID=UPI0033D9CA9B